METIDINITDTTEGNRIKKFEQLEKCFNGEIPDFIPADNTRHLPAVNIKMKDFSNERVEKALRTLAFSFDIPTKSAKGEIFYYKAQEDLTDKWCRFFSDFVRNTYDFITDYLDLPKKTVMTKSVLTYKGKILYSPQTGEPIRQSDWNKFVNDLEKFLNRNIKDVEKKITLESKSLAKILNRMLKYNTLDAVKKTPLSSLEYHGKSFDWISESVKNMKNAFGDSFTRKEQTRIEVLSQSAAQKVTNVTEKMRGDIKQILIDGVAGKRSKGQVSQALFDKMVGDNRDFQRIADTEIQNAFNNSFIQEEVYNAENNEKVYFKRIEVIDSNTCQKCKAINGKIAVWSDRPQNSEKSKDKKADYVIWEGKDGNGWECPISTKHPYCRGVWTRHYIGLDNIDIDALVAEQSGNAKKWNNAVKQAKEEYKQKGIENPDDSTMGFTERINELYNGNDIKKSILQEKNNHKKTINDRLFALWTRRLSPDFAKEYVKLCDLQSKKFITDKLYEIKGFPKEQDCENLYLLDIGEDYFVINCFGDWQDEMFIKISLVDYKLIAEIVKDCQKEDGRLLNRKNNYILEFGKQISKSLTYSGHKLQGRTNFNGLNISIENKKGSVRRGTDPDGHEWAIKMHYDYGYIRGTEGVDGDHVDCYIGDNENARNVYIIHQKILGTDIYDEDKCMLGFSTLADAKTAYLRQYDKPGFFGGVDTVPFDVFKKNVLMKKWHGRKLTIK